MKRNALFLTMLFLGFASVHCSQQVTMPSQEDLQKLLEDKFGPLEVVTDVSKQLGGQVKSSLAIVALVNDVLNSSSGQMTSDQLLETLLQHAPKTLNQLEQLGAYKKS